MKIAFYLNRFPVLSETFILHQITGLLERGHDVRIVTNSLGDLVNKHIDVDRYRLIERTQLLSETKVNPRPLAFDILHCHFGPAGIVGWILRDGGLFRGKLITSFYGYDVNRHPR